MLKAFLRLQIKRKKARACGGLNTQSGVTESELHTPSRLISTEGREMAKMKEITFSKGVTYSRNYNSVRAEISMTVTLENGDNKKEVMDTLSEIVRNRVAEEIKKDGEVFKI